MSCFSNSSKNIIAVVIITLYFLALAGLFIQIICFVFTISRCSGNSRFPRVEDMPHFHYDFVDLGEDIQVSLTCFKLFIMSIALSGVQLIIQVINKIRFV